MLHLLLPPPLALGTKATEVARGRPRLGDGVSGSPSHLSLVALRPRLHTGRRPCVRISLSPPASAVPWEPGRLPRVAGRWLRRCFQEGEGIPLPSSIGDDEEQFPPKQKIRIKLRSYWVPLIEDSCKKITEAAKTTNAKTMGPVPLPTKRRVYCVLNSPHVHKDSRFHFEIRTHQRLIDIMYDVSNCPNN